jgi:hypothetical protein
MKKVIHFTILLHFFTYYLSFLSKSKLLCAITTIRQFQNLANGATQNSRYLMGNKTLSYSFCNIIIYDKQKLRGKGNLFDKEGKILHCAFISKPRNTIYDETSY